MFCKEVIWIAVDGRRAALEGGPLNSQLLIVPRCGLSRLNPRTVRLRAHSNHNTVLCSPFPTRGAGLHRACTQKQRRTLKRYHGIRAASGDGSRRRRSAVTSWPSWQKTLKGRLCRQSTSRKRRVWAAPHHQAGTVTATAGRLAGVGRGAANLGPRLRWAIDYFRTQRRRGRTRGANQIFFRMGSEGV